MQHPYVFHPRAQCNVIHAFHSTVVHPRRANTSLFYRVAARGRISSPEAALNATLILAVTGYFLFRDVLSPALDPIFAHILRLSNHGVEPTLHSRPKHKIRVQPWSKVSIPSCRTSSSTFKCRHRRASCPHPLSSPSTFAHQITQARTVLL